MVHHDLRDFVPVHDAYQCEDQKDNTQVGEGNQNLCHALHTRS